MAKIAPRSARLTVEEAVYEFGEARSTIQRALIRAGKAPGDDGRWSTAQIRSALTQLRQPSPQQRRLLKARAEKLEYEIKQRRADLIPAAEVSAQLARIGAALGRVIDHSKLEAREKADLNQDLLQLSAHRPVSASTGPSKRKRKRRKRTLG